MSSRRSRQARPNISEEDLRAFRVTFIRRARVTVEDRVESLLILDVGLRGVYVERGSPLPVGAEARVRFTVPGNEQPIEAGCRVAWCHTPETRLVTKSLPYGCGLEFVAIDDASRRRVREYVLEHVGRDPRRRRFARRWPDPDEYLADLK